VKSAIPFGPYMKKGWDDFIKYRMSGYSHGGIEEELEYIKLMFVTKLPMNTALFFIRNVTS
jgi:hypothetical protein